jgi:hypothetical protein
MAVLFVASGTRTKGVVESPDFCFEIYPQLRENEHGVRGIRRQGYREAE